MYVYIYIYIYICIHIMLYYTTSYHLILCYQRDLAVEPWTSPKQKQHNYN